MPGGALHYLDCKKGAKKTNGVKDLDVYSFYADDPEIPWPYRRHGVADFGASSSATTPTRGATSSGGTSTSWGGHCRWRRAQSGSGLRIWLRDEQ